MGATLPERYAELRRASAGLPELVEVMEGPRLAPVPTATMVIQHVLAAGEVGGLERVVRSIAAGHRARGSRVVVAPVVESASAGHPFVESLRGLDLPIVVSPRGYFSERALGDALVRDGVPARRVHVIRNAWGRTGDGTTERTDFIVRRPASVGWASGWDAVASPQPTRDP